MKLKLKKQELLYLEDILLGNYYGLPLNQVEGSMNLRKLLDKVQDKLYGDDIFSQGDL